MIVGQKRSRRHLSSSSFSSSSSSSSSSPFVILTSSVIEIEYLRTLRVSSSSPSEVIEALSRLAQGLYLRQQDIYDHTNILKHRWLLHTLLNKIDECVPATFDHENSNGAKFGPPTVNQMMIANLALTCLANMVHSTDEGTGSDGTTTAQRTRVYSMDTAIALTLEIRAIPLFLRVLRYALSFHFNPSSSSLSTINLSTSLSNNDTRTIDNSGLYDPSIVSLYPVYQSMVTVILSILSIVSNFIDLSGNRYGKAVQYTISRLPLMVSSSASAIASTTADNPNDTIFHSLNGIGTMNQHYYASKFDTAFLPCLETYALSTSLSTHEGFLYVLDILSNLLTEPANVPYIETWIRSSSSSSPSSILSLILQCIRIYPDTFLLESAPTALSASSSSTSIKSEGIYLFNPPADLEISNEKYYSYLVTSAYERENDHEMPKKRKEDIADGKVSTPGLPNEMEPSNHPSETQITTEDNTKIDTDVIPSHSTRERSPSSSNPLASFPGSTVPPPPSKPIDRIHWSSVVSLDQLLASPVRYRYMAIQRRDASIIFLSKLLSAINSNVSSSSSSSSVDSTTTNPPQLSSSSSSVDWLHRTLLSSSNDFFPTIMGLFATTFGIRDIRLYLLIILKELIRNNSNLLSHFKLYNDTRITSFLTNSNLPTYSDTFFHGTPIDLVPIMILQTIQSYRIRSKGSHELHRLGSGTKNEGTTPPIDNHTPDASSSVATDNPPTGNDIPTVLEKCQSKVVNELFSLLSPYTSPESIRNYDLFLRKKK